MNAVILLIIISNLGIFIAVALLKGKLTVASESSKYDYHTYVGVVTELGDQYLTLNPIKSNSHHIHEISDTFTFKRNSQTYYDVSKQFKKKNPDQQIRTGHVVLVRTMGDIASTDFANLITLHSNYNDYINN